MKLVNRAPKPVELGDEILKSASAETSGSRGPSSRFADRAMMLSLSVAASVVANTSMLKRSNSARGGTRPHKLLDDVVVNSRGCLTRQSLADAEYLA